ncbi:hypothetical protein [Loktanella sp. M215]|uniref:hypothetical protein n=1 Tax=Loktanella sp. M215 TaxID=2675431 RepID=UPI001F2320FB|nr:hypothetical protein [Loktanella sp. M215]
MQMNSALKANGLITPLTRLLDQMAAHGAVRFYAKRIAPNDNSKIRFIWAADLAP